MTLRWRLSVVYKQHPLSSVIWWPFRTLCYRVICTFHVYKSLPYFVANIYPKNWYNTTPLIFSVDQLYCIKWGTSRSLQYFFVLNREILSFRINKNSTYATLHGQLINCWALVEEITMCIVFTRQYIRCDIVDRRQNTILLGIQSPLCRSFSKLAHRCRSQHSLFTPYFLAID